MLKWPDARAVDEAVRRWAASIGAARPDLLQVGYFGSYARGDWGVGSDLDLILIVRHADGPFQRRSGRWDTTQLPVAADVLVYTIAEWDRLGREKGRFFRTLQREAVWVYYRPVENSTGQKSSEVRSQC